MQANDYLDHVRSYPCIACLAIGRKNYNTFAHHEDLTAKYRYNKRATDFVAVPLCVFHHEERHKLGKIKFWEKYLSDYRRVYSFVLILLKSFFDIEDFRNIDEDYLLSIEDDFSLRKKFDEILEKAEYFYKERYTSVEENGGEQNG